MAPIEMANKDNAVSYFPTAPLVATVPLRLEVGELPALLEDVVALVAVTLIGILAITISGYAEQLDLGSSGQFAAMQMLCSSGGALIPMTEVGGAQRVLNRVLSVPVKEEASEGLKPRDMAAVLTVARKKFI